MGIQGDPKKWKRGENLEPWMETKYLIARCSPIWEIITTSANKLTSMYWEREAMNYSWPLHPPQSSPWQVGFALLSCSPRCDTFQPRLFHVVPTSTRHAARGSPFTRPNTFIGRITLTTEGLRSLFLLLGNALARTFSLVVKFRFLCTAWRTSWRFLKEPWSYWQVEHVKGSKDYTQYYFFRENNYKKNGESTTSELDLITLSPHTSPTFNALISQAWGA